MTSADMLSHIRAEIRQLRATLHLLPPACRERELRELEVLVAEYEAAVTPAEKRWPEIEALAARIRAALPAKGVL